MNFLAVLRLAFLSLARNKMRSFLTGLGIIIGVSSVITMVGLGFGAYQSVQNEIAKMGTNLIMVMPGSARRRGHAGGMGTMTNLKSEDAIAIRNECMAVSLTTPVVRSNGQAVYAGRNWSTTIWGATADYFPIRSWQVLDGRQFSANEALSGAKVCVLGKTVVENLFGSSEAIGKTIRVKNIPLEVIGILESRGQTGMGMDQDDLIIAPLSIIQRRMAGINHVHMIFASAVTEEAVATAKDEITSLLQRRKNKTATSEEDGFRVDTQADIAEMAGSTLSIMALLLGSVASVSLLVGGIGIMNIMLVSVTERTREIGIRMAIGAKSKDILTQFLAEAAALSSSGGLFGIALGIGFTYLINLYTKWPTVVSWLAITIGFLFSAAVGIFFGLYPAYKASQLDPIEALRFE